MQKDLAVKRSGKKQTRVWRDVPLSYGKRWLFPLFGGRFLRKQEQPLHDCTMRCIHRYEHCCTTVVTFGKRCELSVLALPDKSTSAVR